MRLAIIENQFVKNVVIADTEFADSQNWDYVVLDDQTICESGWFYDGKKFIKPVVIDETLAE